MVIIDTKKSQEDHTALLEEQERLTQIIMEKVSEEKSRLQQILYDISKFPYSKDRLSDTIVEFLEIMDDILFVLEESEIMDRKHIDLVAKLCDVYKVDDRIRWSKE